LPLGVFTRLEDGGRKPLPAHPLAVALRKPNPDSTSVEFRQGMIACLLLYGNGYAEKLITGGKVRGLTILHPELMSIERTEAGLRRYIYDDPRGRRVYSEDEIWHLKGFNICGDLGLSPIAYQRQSLATAIATDEAAGRTFANGMKPSGFFTYDKTLTPEQREQARRVLVEPYTGAGNVAKVGILEAGFKWEQVTIPPEDAELLASRAWHVEELCRWYDMPPILIGHSPQGQTMWGSGVEQIMIGWLTTSLGPFLKLIEESMWASLVSPDERSTVYLEHNVDGLLRADSAGRAEMYSKLTQVGAITPNQIADKENFPRFEGGDVHLVNSTLVPLNMAGQRPGRVQPAPGEPVPED
jgi:HK97 family phage portal protein